MINDNPRDAAPHAIFQHVTEEAAARGTHFGGWAVDATGVNLPQERRSQSPSPSLRQGYPLMNTSGSDSNSPGRGIPVETVRLTASPFYEPLRPFYGPHVLFRGPQVSLPGSPEEPSHIPIAQSSRTSFTVSPVAPHIHDSDNLDAYDFLGEPPGAAGLPLNNQSSFPQSWDERLASTSALPPSPSFGHEYSFPTSTYHDTSRIDYHTRGPPTLFASTHSPFSLHDTSEDPNGGFAPSRAAPHQSGLLTARDLGIESQRPHSGVPHKNLNCASPLPRSEGSRRPRVTGPSIPLLTPPLIGLDPRDRELRLSSTPPTSTIRAQEGAGCSGYGLITPGGMPQSIQYLRAGKRKRSSDQGEDEGMTRGLPRPRRNAVSEGSTPIHPTLPPITPRRIKIDQIPYACGNSQHNWAQQNAIEFTVNGQPGIKLTDALDHHFSGLDGGYDQMFQYDGAGSSVSCRLQFAGFPARSPQITTADHKKTRNPRTRKKLAFEVAKRIKGYVKELKIEMRCENMVLTKLVHVSRASWQPEIWYDQEPANDS